MGTKLAGVSSLSDRQKEILRLVAQHHQAKEIARILRISESTVKTHTDEARRRLGVGTSRQAARLLIAHEVRSILSREDGFKPEAASDLSGSASHWLYEQALLSQQRASPYQTSEYEDNPKDSSGAFQHADSYQRSEQEQEARSDRFSDGVVEGRWGSVGKRLKALNIVQWCGLIILISVLLPLIMGVLLQAAHATFESLQLLHSRSE